MVITCWVCIPLFCPRPGHGGGGALGYSGRGVPPSFSKWHRFGGNDALGLTNFYIKSAMNWHLDQNLKNLGFFTIITEVQHFFDRNCQKAYPCSV